MQSLCDLSYLIIIFQKVQSHISMALFVAHHMGKSSGVNEIFECRHIRTQCNRLGLTASKKQHCPTLQWVMSG